MRLHAWNSSSKQGFNKGLSVKGVAILSITGLKKRNSFSVLHAILEQVYKAVRSWKTAIWT